VEDVVTDTVFGLIRNLLVTLATLVLMVRFSWQLTLVVLVLIPLVALPARRAGRATYRAREQTQTKLAEMTAYLQEILGISGILLVKAFVKGRAERDRFGGINDELRRLQVRQEMIGRWFGMLMGTVQTAGPALIILAGGYLVLQGQTTVGTVFVFATVLGARLAGAATSLASMHVNVIGSLALFRRLFDYIDLPPDITDSPDATVLDGEVRGGLRLEHLTPGHRLRTAHPSRDRAAVPWPHQPGHRPPAIHRASSRPDRRPRPRPARRTRHPRPAAPARRALHRPSPAPIPAPRPTESPRPPANYHRRLTR
jgi:ATP-binding cassette subfamily B protein